MMLGIMAVSDQKDYCMFYRQWHVQGGFCLSFHLAMCSLMWLLSPGCSSSWPVWTRKDSFLLWQWHVQGEFCRLRCTSRCVPFSGLQAPTVRRPLTLGVMAVWTGRTVAGLLVSVHFALCSLVHRPLMSDIMAVMDQKDSYDISFAVQRQTPWSKLFV